MQEEIHICLFTTCTFRIAHFRKSRATLLKISIAKFIFPPRKVIQHICNIDRLCPYMHKERTIESVRQIFSIVHTEFLLDDRGDPGLWSERGQSRAKTWAILRLKFLARATQMYKSTLGYSATWQYNVPLQSWQKYYCFTRMGKFMCTFNDLQTINFIT